ncbi:START domain-containing protein [Bacteroidota bacterium]
MIKYLLYTLVFIVINEGLLHSQETSNSDWQLAKTKDEISIYTRKVNYSDYKEFKAEMIVNSKPDAIVIFLQNIDGYKEWLPDCLESKKLYQISSTEQINYLITDVPWPYEDRDIIYRFKVTKKNSKSGQFRILIENKPKYLDLKKNIVRIPNSLGFWVITPISENQTKVVYQMHVEPGGYVPAWLANLKIVDTPYTFLYNLREQVEKN